MPRLTEYFSQNKSANQAVKLLLARDYEGMYQYAYNAIQIRHSSLKYKAKQLFLSMLNHFA